MTAAMDNRFFDSSPADPDFDIDIDIDTDETDGCEDEQQEMFEHFRFELDKGQAPMRG